MGVVSSRLRDSRERRKLRSGTVAAPRREIIFTEFDDQKIDLVMFLMNVTTFHAMRPVMST